MKITSTDQQIHQKFLASKEYRQTLAYQSGEIRQLIKQILIEMGIISVLDRVLDRVNKFLIKYGNIEPID